MAQRAALIVSDLQGGDYQVALVDEERFAQIRDAVSSDGVHLNPDRSDVVSYLLLDEQEANTLHSEHPDIYPGRRGAMLGTRYTQDYVIEPSEDWPEVTIFSILTVPCT